MKRSDSRKIRTDPFTFEPPAIQWNSNTEPFPLDFKKAIGEAKNYVLSQSNADDTDLVLRRIVINRFLPEAAIAAKHLSMGDNMHHWILEIEFSQTAEAGAVYRLNMLLDGRIVGGRWE